MYACAYVRACMSMYAYVYMQVVRRAASAAEDRLEAEAKLREEEGRREVQKERRDEAEVREAVRREREAREDCTCTCTD